MNKQDFAMLIESIKQAGEIKRGLLTLKNLSKASLYTPGQPTTITIEVEIVDKVGQFRGRHGVEVIEPLKVQSKGQNWLTAWDQVWPQADV